MSEYRKLKLVTITINEIEKCTNSENLLIRFVPHQSAPLYNANHCSTTNFPNGQFEDVVCVCGNPSTKELPMSFNTTLSNKFREDPTRIIWINPGKMDISCFILCLCTWLDFSESIKVPTLLGIQIPTSLKPSNSIDNMCVWHPKLNSILDVDFNQISNAIWYPSLARSKRELLYSASKLELLKIFPISEVINEVKIGTFPDMSNHKEFLDMNRVRTERIIYIDRRTPEATFELLVNSIRNLPRSSTIDITPIVTPGGEPINYLTEALAASITNSVLLLRKNETFSETLSDDCIILRSEG